MSAKNKRAKKVDKNKREQDKKKLMSEILLNQIAYQKAFHNAIYSTRITFFDWHIPKKASWACPLFNTRLEIPLTTTIFLHKRRRITYLKIHFYSTNNSVE
jgi:hypothetical protein